VEGELAVGRAWLVGHFDGAAKSARAVSRRRGGCEDAREGEEQGRRRAGEEEGRGEAKAAEAGAYVLG